MPIGEYERFKIMIEAMKQRSSQDASMLDIQNNHNEALSHIQVVSTLCGIGAGFAMNAIKG